MSPSYIKMFAHTQQYVTSMLHLIFSCLKCLEKRCLLEPKNMALGQNYEKVQLLFMAVHFSLYSYFQCSKLWKGSTLVYGCSFLFVFLLSMLHQSSLSKAELFSENVVKIHCLLQCAGFSKTTLMRKLSNWETLLIWRLVNQYHAPQSVGVSIERHEL